MALDWQNYFNANPDVQQAYAGSSTFQLDPGNASGRFLNPVSEETFAKSHYDQFGKNEGRVWGAAPSTGILSGGNTTGTTTKTTGGGGSSAVVSPGDLTLNQVTPYVAPSTYRPEYGDTVAGQLGGILTSGSPYLLNARKSGERTADARGLLNSSLAGEYGEKAAIEAALPIAQQDSNVLTTSGLNQQQGQISGALAGQEASNQGGIINLQTANSSRLSAQDAAQKMELEKMVQAEANARAGSELGSNQKQQYSNSVTTLGNELQAQIAKIDTDPNMTSESKTAAINNLYKVHQANLNSLSAIYGVEISWSI